MENNYKKILLICSLTIATSLFLEANDKKMELLDLTEDQKKELQYKEFILLKNKYIENLEQSLEFNIIKTNELINCLKKAEVYSEVKTCFESNNKKYSAPTNRDIFKD